MPSEQFKDNTVSIELTDREYALVHEMLLRGLREVDKQGHKYGMAYDSFVDSSGRSVRIGDQPENVREVWDEIVASACEQRGESENA